MTNQPSAHDAQDAATPRWVKVLGIASLVLIVLAIILVLLGHGPGNHGSAGVGPTAGALLDAV